MNSNKELVEKLVDLKVIKSKEVENAFRKIDRANFVPEKFAENAYENKPLPIGKNATISQPLVVAFMTEYLSVKDEMKIMEIGTGSGYQAAILSVLNPNGLIITIENSKKLHEEAKEKLKKYKNVKLIHGNGFNGSAKNAPYDRIIATAFVKKIPEKWKEQLKENGRIITPVGINSMQFLTLFEKKNNELKEKDLGFPCVFVPMKNQQ